MYKARALLEVLTKKIPPGTGQRHSITLNPTEGKLEVTMMLGDEYIPFMLEETDLDLRVIDLVETIHGVLDKLGRGPSKEL